MSPTTVAHRRALAKARGARRHNRNPLPDALELIMRAPMLALPIALMASSIVDRMLQKRGTVVAAPSTHQRRFGIGPFEQERTAGKKYGLWWSAPNLNEAPLSAEQASQEWIWRRLRNPCTAQSHTEMRDDDETWATLERVKDWVFGDEVLEQRNCPQCGSTLARRKSP